MAELSFLGSFTQQDAISEMAINAAVDVLRSGRIMRDVVGAESP